MELFFSEKTNCSNCHGGFAFTEFQFRNNGLYSNYEDNGRFRFTHDSTDLALFKVPSLRNVQITKPYMHDGSIHSLKEVIEHYNSGGANHKNKSEFIRPLNLNKKEKQALVLFLNTLTDKIYLN